MKNELKLLCFNNSLGLVLSTFGKTIYGLYDSMLYKILNKIHFDQGHISTTSYLDVVPRGEEHLMHPLHSKWSDARKMFKWAKVAQGPENDLQ